MSNNHDEILQSVQHEFVCDHEEIKTRLKRDKAGRPLYVNQCVRCGQQLGGNLPHKQFSEGQIQALEPWDAQLENQHNRAFSEKLIQRNREAKERLRNEFLQRHDEFLKSDVWKKLKKKIMDRANHVCEGCGESRATQIHHMNYERWGGNELLIDLLAVCDRCHGILHPNHQHTVDVLIDSRNLARNNRGEFSPRSES